MNNPPPEIVYALIHSPLVGQGPLRYSSFTISIETDMVDLGRSQSRKVCSFEAFGNPARACKFY